MSPKSYAIAPISHCALLRNLRKFWSGDVDVTAACSSSAAKLTVAVVTVGDGTQFAAVEVFNVPPNLHLHDLAKGGIVKAARKRRASKRSSVHRSRCSRQIIDTDADKAGDF
jgi:hypothetical protein